MSIWTDWSWSQNSVEFLQNYTTREARRPMWRSAFAGAIILALFSASSLAQTSQDLKADAGTTGDVLVYGMGYSGQRFSPLIQINKENVGKLVPVWAYSLADLQGGGRDLRDHA
jgi:glucose dehydrogenase